ncbi:MAG: hypothetical protein CM15mP120_29700 [Pseudomonadota bacterium]|nr:MAG: hypothetical protein CM15mP120_29700 [Pseudomonadota bacterium]
MFTRHIPRAMPIDDEGKPFFTAKEAGHWVLPKPLEINFGGKGACPRPTQVFGAKCEYQ